MSKLNDKIDSAMGLDVDKLIKDAEDDVSDLDQKDIEKYNERKETITKLKQDLKDARSLSDPNWAKALLKKSAEKIVVTQEIFGAEIEDDPVSRNITALGELSNSLVNTLKGVLDVDREREKIDISKEKNDLRRMELESGVGEGKVLPGTGKTIVGIGTNEDILKLIKNGVDPTKPTSDPDSNEGE